MMQPRSFQHVLIAVVVLSMAACSGTPTGSRTTEEGRSVETPTSMTSASRPTTSVVPTSSTTRPLLSGFSALPPEGAPPVLARPGDELRFDGDLDRLPERSSIDQVWIRLVGSRAEPTGELSATLGAAILSTEGRVLLSGTIPHVMARRPSTFGAATIMPTPLGEYEIEVSFRRTPLRVRITEPGRLPAPVPPRGRSGAEQVLNGSGIAGIALGTDAATAERRLIARFGDPVHATPWSTGCIGWYRWLRWPGLAVTLHGDDVDSAVFESYVYGNNIDAGEPIGLFATSTGIELGSTPAQLRALDPEGTFHTDYQAPGARFWRPSSGEELAILNEDFLAPGAFVAAMGAPASKLMTVC